MTVLKGFCRMVFQGVCSLAALVVYFVVCRALILTEHIVPQVIAVALMLCLTVAFFYGGVHCIFDAAKRNTKPPSALDDQDLPASDDVLQSKGE